MNEPTTPPVNPKESCPACEAPSLPFRRGPRRLDLWRCPSCETVFLGRRDATRARVEELEKEHFAEGFVRRQTAWQALFERLLVARTRRRIRRYKNGGALLEVGVGSGAFLRAARDAGFDATGVDPSPAIVDHVRETLQLHVVAAFLEDFRPEDGRRFDVVVMNHVLEHLREPRAALMHLRSLVADDALLHVAVPNVGAWEARLPGWTSYEPYHLFYFSAGTLADTLQAAGFRVVKTETVEPFSGWFNAIVRTLFARSYETARNRIEDAGPSSWKTQLLTGALNLGRVGFGALTLPLRWVQARLGFGEELVVLATPEAGR